MNFDLSGVHGVETNSHFDCFGVCDMEKIALGEPWGNLPGLVPVSLRTSPAGDKSASGFCEVRTTSARLRLHWLRTYPMFAYGFGKFKEWMQEAAEAPFRSDGKPVEL